MRCTYANVIRRSMFKATWLFRARLPLERSEDICKQTLKLCKREREREIERERLLERYVSYGHSFRKHRFPYDDNNEVSRTTFTLFYLIVMFIKRKGEGVSTSLSSPHPAAISPSSS